MIAVLKKNKTTKETKQEIVCYLKEDVVLSDRMKNTFDYVKITDEQFAEIEKEFAANKVEDGVPVLEIFFEKDTEKLKFKQDGTIKEKEIKTKKKDFQKVK